MKPVLHIADALKQNRGHISFHTPGHKRTGGGDLTELSYTDNLSSPTGAIARAEEDVARILGAKKSFILTDGSTSGVMSMLYALKRAGANSVALSPYSHKSVKNGCMLCGLKAVEITVRTLSGIPLQPSAEEIARALSGADALLLTSPDYYGFFPPLNEARELTKNAGKPLLLDGAHGAHLHFTDEYAGKYADLWVDGAHKSLPALTQGAVVSANGEYAAFLKEAVGVFRTTSPSYPIMASVERAVKYPRKISIERAAQRLKRELGAIENDDWTKIVLPYGDNATRAQRYFEEHGVYPEFNDGNYLMFYLSPCTKENELKTLGALARAVPYGRIADEDIRHIACGRKTEKVLLADAVGRVCAREAGFFPPCIPLLRAGDIIGADAAARLQRADGAFGIEDGKVLVYLEEE